ncbi:cell surface protein [Levilactobacillus senmaizukei DSM 21775 = NBRC 103853]|uniref:Cell surface protein n=1 Tax=Levilactobacillus senmaizukei DSM 21775 = NBRC 103853 TaxID=1423803 RepID=A0A0R2DEE3_9LACO|nr:DUF916 and DUF3324 domain-containing protein [Levilactobacillus senmaizukei]KRN02376.1 cell surface protein [Levilactobacillus senmaizukei DSM 21775 = NBRC 103853]
MKRGLKFLLALGFAMMSLAGQIPTAAANSVGYTVRAMLPSNQDDPTVNYFALRTKPNARQRLTIVINNTSSTRQKYWVNVNQAVTNDNGVIDYSQTNPKLDPSLKVGIKDIFTKASNQKVTVPANTQKRVALTYRMPAKKLRGIILGGVYVEQVPPKAHNSGSAITLNNAFSYAIGIRLRENTKTIAPNLRLHQIQAVQVNRRNLVTANLQNSQPGIMQKLTVNARVTNAGSTQTLIRQQQSGMGMAPNSNFNFGIPWGNQNLPSGRYTLYLSAKAGAQKWQFKRNFTIQGTTVRRLNKTVLTPTKQPNYWLYALLGLLIAMLLAVIGYLLYRDRHEKLTK